MKILNLDAWIEEHLTDPLLLVVILAVVGGLAIFGPTRRALRYVACGAAVCVVAMVTALRDRIRERRRPF